MQMVIEYTYQASDKEKSCSLFKKGFVMEEEISVIDDEHNNNA